MSAVAENILTGLPAGRAAVFLGEAGCGKSELAVHLALSLAGQGREVHFFDLDQTKPLMRSRDAQELLEGAGVTVHFERQTADAPTQVGGLVPLLLAPDKNVILDVGGGDAGARLIGGYSHLLKNADVWFIVNPYRPWSGSTEHIDGTLSAILRAARLKLPRFLLNPNLGQETTAEEYLAGLEDGLAMLSPYVPVEGAAVPAALLARVAALLCHGAQETVPAIGRGAHAEAHGDAAADLSLLEIGANRRSLGTLQRLVVPARGVAVQLEHTAAELLRPAVVFLLRHGEIHPPRQKADRVRIGEVFDLHDEVDDAAALFAPEAVIELLVLQHMERGRFFIVKRAAAPVAPALARERDVSTDHVDNVVAGEQLVQKAL